MSEHMAGKASDEARYLTGIELVVDGGLTLNCV